MLCLQGPLPFGVGSRFEDLWIKREEKIKRETGISAALHSSVLYFILLFNWP